MKNIYKNTLMIFGIIFLVVGAAVFPGASKTTTELQKTTAVYKEAPNHSMDLYNKTSKFPWTEHGETIKSKILNDIQNVPIKTNTMNKKQRIVRAATIYVDDSNIAGPWYGTLINPYQHIQNGVDAANIGDTVFVFSGIYHENVLINKAITLTGEYTDTTIIDGGGCGIAVYSASADVRMFTIQNGEYGIYLFASSNSNVADCVISNTYYGIMLSDESPSCTIRNCTVSNNQCGIYPLGSNNCNIINCTVSNNVYFGIYIDSSENCYLRNNTIYNNAFNFAVDWAFFHDIDTSNTVDGKPIYYLVEQRDLVFDETSSVGFLGLISCENITVNNLDTEGITVAGTTSSSFSHITSHQSIYGILLLACSMIVISDVSLSDCVGGFYLTGCSQVFTTGCAISRNYDDLQFLWSDSCTLNDCTTEKAIWSMESSSISLTNCTSEGIALWQSTTCSLRNNIVDWFTIYGWDITVFYHDIDSSNTVDGKPIIYLIGQQDMILDGNDNIGFLGLVSCTNVTIQNADIRGIVCANTTQITIDTVRVHDTYLGIFTLLSSQMHIRNSLIYNNAQHGVCLTGTGTSSSADNEIINCRLFDNYADGLYTECSPEIHIINSTFSNNMYGIYFYGSPSCDVINCAVSHNSAHGIYVAKSSYCTIQQCRLYQNGYDGVCLGDSSECNVLNCEVYENYNIGIYLIDSECTNNNIAYCHSYNNSHYGVYFFLSATGNVVHHNTIDHNGVYGVYSEYAYDNIIHHNNIFDNAQNAQEDYSNNIWDDGHEGNYWSDYTGTDNNHDGIGDTPYSIPGGNSHDCYPFMYPDGWLNSPPTTPSQPTGLMEGIKGAQYTYTTSAIDPNGDQVYYMWDWGDGIISNWLGPYPSGQMVSATHIWNTHGTYQLKVKAKDTFGAESNWSTPLTVKIYKLGDVNNDGEVTFADIDPFVAAIGTTETQFRIQYPTWVWIAADCNQDGMITFADIDPFVALIGS